MNFKRFFSATICFFYAIVCSTMFGMYKMPPTSAWLPAARQAVGYEQGAVSEHLLPMPQVQSSPEQIEQMQKELMQEYQPASSVWSTTKVRPPVYVESRSYQTPEEAFVLQPEQKSSKKGFKDFSAGPSSALVGMRRFRPNNTSFKVATTATAEMITPQRFLVAGQENNPLWVQANKDIEDFRRKWKIPMLTPLQIQAINQYQEEALKNIVKKFPTSDDAVSQQRKLLLKRDVAHLLKKHGIDPKGVPVYFMSSGAKAETRMLGHYGVVGGAIVIAHEALQNLPEEINVGIEHEISHLIHNDSTYLLYAKESGLLDEPMLDYYLHLLEKRADTHSGIQSKKNVLELMKVAKDVGYDAVLKAHHLVQTIKRVAPEFLFNPEFIEIISREFHDPLLFEKTKRIAIQEYKERKISAQALQEIIKMCNKQTYLQELLEYMTEQEKHPSCIITL